MPGNGKSAVTHIKYTVSREHQCGGSLITKKHVLTIAHCVRSMNIRAQNYIGGFQMILGTSDLTNANLGIIRNVIDSAYHPEYKGRVYFDISIVTANEILGV